METYDPDYDSLEEEMSQSEMKAKKELENLKETKNSEIDAKDSEELNLKLSQSDMIVKEMLENPRETKNSEISAKDFEIQTKTQI